jgi:pimeloyl-ACP methyl ester carboxylesterase
MKLIHTLIVAATAVLITTLALNSSGQSTEKSFSVTVTGHGPPVILIPGFSCTGAVWDDTVKHFQDHYECHVLTLAGFGGGPRVPEPFLQTVRTDLAAYIRERKLDHPIIIGHSLGGSIVLELAEHDPDLPGPLVIVDSLPFVPASYMPNATAQSAIPMAEQIRKAMDVPRAQFIENSKTQVRTMVTGQADYERIMTWVTLTDPEAGGDAMYDLFTTDLRGEIGRIQSPVLVLGTWVAYKKYTTRAAVEATFHTQYAAVKNCKIVMADTRHFIMLDDPQWFYQQIDTFLQTSGSR